MKQLISLRPMEEYGLFHISNDENNSKYFSSIFFVPITILSTLYVFILLIPLWNLKFLFLRNITLIFILLRGYGKRNLNIPQFLLSI